MRLQPCSQCCAPSSALSVCGIPDPWVLLEGWGLSLPLTALSSLGEIESLMRSWLGWWRGCKAPVAATASTGTCGGVRCLHCPSHPALGIPRPSTASSPPISHLHLPQAISILVSESLSWTGDRTSTCGNGSTVRVTLYASQVDLRARGCDHASLALAPCLPPWVLPPWDAPESLYKPGQAPALAAPFPGGAMVGQPPSPSLT